MAALAQGEAEKVRHHGQYCAFTHVFQALAEVTTMPCLRCCKTRVGQRSGRFLPMPSSGTFSRSPFVLLLTTVRTIHGMEDEIG